MSKTLKDTSKYSDVGDNYEKKRKNKDLREKRKKIRTIHDDELQEIADIKSRMIFE